MMSFKEVDRKEKLAAKWRKMRPLEEAATEAIQHYSKVEEPDKWSSLFLEGYAWLLKDEKYPKRLARIPRKYPFVLGMMAAEYDLQRVGVSHGR